MVQTCESQPKSQAIEYAGRTEAYTWRTPSGTSTLNVRAEYAPRPRKIANLTYWVLIRLSQHAIFSYMILEGDLTRKVGNFTTMHDLLRPKTQKEPY